MAFPFDHKNHEVYPNTFLENTAVTLFASDWNGVFSGNFDDLYPKFVERFFRLKKSVDQFKKDLEMSVTAPDDGLSYIFNPNKARLSVDRKKYVSFVDNIMTELFPLKDFMYRVMERSVIENVQVRKLNILPIEAEDDNEIVENADNVYAFLFKKELIEYVKDQPIPDSAPWILSFRRANVDNGNVDISIRIGISKVRNRQKHYNVILDSSARCINHSPIEEGAVDGLLLNLNDCLFDAFHWCVKSEIVEMMRKENEK